VEFFLNFAKLKLKIGVNLKKEELKNKTSNQLKAKNF
jgi:hypothetical protein